MKRTKLLAALVVIGALFALLIPGARADGEHSEKTTIFAALTAMTGTEAPATLTVAASGVTYTVDVTKTTKLVRRFGAKSVLTEFVIGDILEIKGKFGTSATSTVITAEWIKNYSIQRAGGTFKGEITALDCSNNKFTFDPDNRPVQTVNFTSLTKFLRSGTQIGCTDLNVGEKATVIGLWRQSINQIDADRVIVKMSTMKGAITAISLTDGGLPASITVLRDEGAATWTINATSSTLLFKKWLLPAVITDFKVGHQIQAYGVAQAGNILNAMVLRDLSLKKKSD